MLPDAKACLPAILGFGAPVRSLKRFQAYNFPGAKKNIVVSSSGKVVALRRRICELSAATLGVTASLEEATVLQEIANSGCVLTDARYGVITTIDGEGVPPGLCGKGGEIAS